MCVLAKHATAVTGSTAMTDMDWRWQMAYLDASEISLLCALVVCDVVEKRDSPNEKGVLPRDRATCRSEYVISILPPANSYYRLSEDSFVPSNASTR